MKKLIILLFLSSCVFPQKQTSKEENLDKKIIGWWERFYPDGRISNHSSALTHIEFIDDGECRFNKVYFEGNESFNHTYGSLKWEVDSVVPTNVLIKSFRGGFHPDFSISIIQIDKHNLIGKLNFQEYIDTIYLKRLPKLH